MDRGFSHSFNPYSSLEFDEFPSLTFKDIKEKPKRYGLTDGKMDTQTDRQTDNVKTAYPLKLRFVGVGVG